MPLNLVLLKHGNAKLVWCWIVRWFLEFRNFIIWCDMKWWKFTRSVWLKRFCALNLTNSRFAWQHINNNLTTTNISIYFVHFLKHAICSRDMNNILTHDIKTFLRIKCGRMINLHCKVECDSVNKYRQVFEIKTVTCYQLLLDYFSCSRNLSIMLM